jgi:hypothetical protein
VALVPCTDKKEVLEIDLLFNQRTGITLHSMRLHYTALLGPSILIVMVESYCASNLLHYHIHTHIAPSKARHLQLLSDMGARFWGNMANTKPVMERAPPWIVLRPYRFGRFDDGDVLRLAKRNEVPRKESQVTRT